MVFNSKVFVVIVATMLAVTGAIIVLSNNDSSPKSYLTDGYALEIFGNANGDWYIDEDDVTFIEKIIAGEENETAFADANRDGVIDQLDIDQVRAIINGTATFIWILDGARDGGLEKKVNLPIERIGVEYLSNAELMCILGVQDKVVALDLAPYMMKDFYFPNRTDILPMGQMHQNPDFETILGMNLDVLFTFPEDTSVKQTNLPGTDVVFLGLYWPNVLEPQDSRFLQGVLKAGYMLDAVDRAYDYVEWILGLAEDISSKTADLTADQMPRVLMTSHANYFLDGTTLEASIYTQIDPLSQACMLAGGKPIAESLPEWAGTGNVYGTKVNLEFVIQEDPEFIFAHTVRYTYSGLTRNPAYGYNVDDPAAYNAAVNAMLNLTLLSEVSAVTNQNIYITAGDFRNNAMGGILGAVYLAKILHPDLFADMDPQAIHQSYITDWMGLDYDLSQHGVFIAPAVV